MTEGAIFQTIMTAGILLIFLGFFIWGIKTGQFKDVEEAKYRMLKEDKHPKDEQE